jgi:predicted GIY-YIG superfamily endonuclease
MLATAILKQRRSATTAVEARNTFSRRPVSLVYQEQFDALGEALRHEYQLKRWSRAEKEAGGGRSGESERHCHHDGRSHRVAAAWFGGSDDRRQGRGR